MFKQFYAACSSKDILLCRSGSKLKEAEVGMIVFRRKPSSPIQFVN
jgi:hypothetical protein